MRFLNCLLVAASLAVLPACTHLTPTEQQLEDCATSAVQSQLNGPTGLLNQVANILNGGQINWQSTLDNLLNVAGPAVVCAVQTTVKNIEAGGGTTTTASAATLADVHGNMWLVSDGHFKLVKPQ